MTHHVADVLVIGAGSAGENVALDLARAGRRVVLADDGLVGGECKYLACVPSKALLRSAEARHEGTRWVDLGAASADPDRGPDDGAYDVAVRRRDELSQQRDDAAAADEVRDAGVFLLRDRAVITGPGTATVGADEVAWTDVVVATGSAPNEVDGFAGVPTWGTADALSSPERPGSVVLLGGGAVGCELAQAWARFGVDVSLVEPGEQLLGREEPTVAARLRELLEREVRVYVGKTPVRGEQVGGRTRVHLDDGTVLDADRVVVSAGRHPRVDGIGLETLGIGDLELDDRCRVVGAEHVWAAGDVTGVAPYTHTASHQARVLVANLLGGDARVVADAIPRAVYTDPPVASVGLDAATARNRGLDTCTASFDLDDLPRNNIDGGPGGLLVLTADRARGVLIGAAAVGPGADEWIGEPTLAVRAEVPLAVLADVVHPFPTYATALELCYRELRNACER